MIYDSFIFMNEFELLKLRCEELKALNPTHVLVESPWTHSGKRKPLYFQERKDEFRQYDIIHKVFPVVPDSDSQVMEREQRNMIIDFKRLVDGDIWLISDADEIPRADAIMGWHGEFAALAMKGYRYFLNREPHDGVWHHARICRGSYLKQHTPTEIRNSGYPELIPDAGWHFSWMGGMDRIQEKLRSFLHTEMNIPENQAPDKWEKDFEAQPYHEIDASYPKYLQDHQEEFKHMIHPVSHEPVYNKTYQHKDIGP